jgi:deoxyribonuclease V
VTSWTACCGPGAGSGPGDGLGADAGSGILTTWTPTPPAPDYGLCAAVDMHYLSTGGARAAAVPAADAAFTHVLTARTAVVPRAAPGRPGEFYRRELPPLRAVLEDLSGLGLLAADGYADLDPDGRPGLGAHVHAELGIAVIGVAKSRFRTATRAVPVLRGSPVRPLLSPRPGCPRPTPRTWSGAWPAGTGCPTRCAAPTPLPGQARPQLP